MKKYKRLIPVAAVVLLLGILLAFGLTSAYLTDKDIASNVVTIGKVSLELDEGSFVDSSVIAAGQSLVKAPSLKNTGTVDEYVFISVAVPKKTVTLLYEDSTAGENAHRKGTKIYGEPREDEIFRMIAEGGNVAEIEGNDNASVALTYHAGTASAEGWVSLNTFNTEKVTDGVRYKIYYFGYNKRLAAEGNAETVTLFDRIQLKSFIDEELTNENREDTPVTVKISAYGIQADKLGIDGLPAGDGYLTKQQLSEVFGVVMRKQATA